MSMQTLVNNNLLKHAAGTSLFCVRELLMKCVTLATVKAFVRRNSADLYVKTLSSFDGMVDGVRDVKDTYRKVDPAAVDLANAQTLGIPGAWFVRGSRDWFTPFAADGFTGFEVSNCCGSCIICARVEVPE